MTGSTVLFHPAYGRASPADIGGKGYNLLRLQHAHRVPPWVALPVDAFRAALAESGLDDWIAGQLQQFEPGQAATHAAAIQARILAMALPECVVTALHGIPFLDQPVSVRSSSADEDGATHSFAGIHESYLYVSGIDAVAEHIHKVWASGYQARALLYRHANRLSLHPVPMAVIIQRMVDACVSGVVFTADPASQNPFVLVIAALYGLGEGLVGAGLPADHIQYDKRSQSLDATIATKETQLVRDTERGGGLTSQPLPDAMQGQPALSKDQTQAVIRAALAVECDYGRPQDIEFCVDDAGLLYLLQTRDITTVSDFGPAAGNRQVWDNANIIESYSGVTSPMTFSFIRHAYTVVYHCFSQVMGIPASTVRANRFVFENMLGLLRGRVFYNLVNWYRLIQQFPGYELNKRFMESMMGLREAFDPEEQKPTSPWVKWGVAFPRLVWLLLRMLWLFATLNGRVARFQARFRECHGRWEAMDFDAMPPHDLQDVYREMETRLLWNWQAPIINDFYVMIHYGLLRKICRDWCGDQNQSLQNDLICGNGDIESTEPTRMLMKLALHIRSDETLLRIFTEHDHHALSRLVPQDPVCAVVAATMEDYLRRYGFRCINELKLEEPSLRETPEFVYQIVRNYLRMDPALLAGDVMAGREQAIRRGAEEKAGTALAQGRFAALRGLVFRHVLRQARKGVRNRENLRFARTRIYGVVRELLHAMGGHFARAGLLDGARDIFYLTMDEVWDFVKGTAVTTDLRALAALRKREFDVYRDAPAPADHVETFGMVYHRNTFRNHQPVKVAEGDLHGIGCCPGTVTAPVRIVRSPRDDLNLNGCILVAARTDPGWVPLYPAVSGLLIERGSILSHSAIVAREMGIPAIVGIQGLLASLKDGQIVTMDGQSGTVRIEPDQAAWSIHDTRQWRGDARDNV